MDINKVLDKLGISELNKMQQEAMNVILRKNDDVVILSPTGSGKTLAYLLPLIQKIDSQLSHVQMLVVVPGRELALQSQRVLKDMGTGLRSMALYSHKWCLQLQDVSMIICLRKMYHHSLSSMWLLMSLINVWRWVSVRK